jgi:hypothetical protein
VSPPRNNAQVGARRARAAGAAPLRRGASARRHLAKLLDRRVLSYPEHSVLI